MSKKKWWVVGSVLVVLVAVKVTALVLGYLYVGVKSPHQRVVVTGAVCSNEYVDQYNAALRNDTADKTTAALQESIQRIVSTSGYRDDPTCAYMLTEAYMRVNDAEKTNEFAGVITKLVEQGQHPTPRISNLQSIEALQGKIEMYREMLRSTTAADAPGGG